MIENKGANLSAYTCNFNHHDNISIALLTFAVLKIAVACLLFNSVYDFVVNFLATTTKRSWRTLTTIMVATARKRDLSVDVC